MRWFHHNQYDPALWCDCCGEKWFAPQSVRWDVAVRTESIQAARDRGWLIEGEYGKVLCPTHATLNRAAAGMEYPLSAS